MLRSSVCFKSACLTVACLVTATTLGQEPNPQGNLTQPAYQVIDIHNNESVRPIDTESNVNDEVRQTQEIQPQPLAPTQQSAQPSVTAPTQATLLSTAIYGPGGVSPSLLSQARRARARRASSDIVLGSESRFRATTDAGSLLGKSILTQGVTAQRRTPIITDTRVRGNGLGRLLASGSLWVPARADLDTMLSKIDSRIIQDTIIIKGPYSTRYGPGTNFIDINLLGSPRYENGFETHGSSSLEYQSNGQAFYARETIWGGDDKWGFRIGYGHRTANDYKTGKRFFGFDRQGTIDTSDDIRVSGHELPSSYKSRDFDVALGYDFTEDSRIEFSYLRLDQTDVEYPGQFFDMDFLVTDGFEMTYILENQCYFDNLTLESWYNRTRFEGNANRSGKRRQIPDLAAFFDTAVTDVDSSSAGYSLATTWGLPEDAQLTLGSDLRFVKQELNNSADSRQPIPPALQPFFGGLTELVLNDVNTPIPRSHWSNPGLFAEMILPSENDELVVTSGARVDWVSTDIDDDPSGFDFRFPQRRLTEELVLSALGFTDAERDFDLWAAFINAELDLDCHWTVAAAAGYAMRAPTLTELYADGALLAVVQSGFNNIFGNPGLDPSRHTQLDLNLKGDYGRFRTGVSGFHAWVEDYITFELVRQSANAPDSRQLRYLNTDLATLTGGEVYGEYDVSCWTTAFGTLSYTEGRDRTRSRGGQHQLDFIVPEIIQVDGPRGIRDASRSEALPGIAPLEARVGVRFAPPCDAPRWGLEMSARIVENQNLVAVSVFEQETPGFTTYDIRGYWRPTDNLSLTFGVENLTDKFYREHLDLRTGLGVYQPGINLYFGSELTF